MDSDDDEDVSRSPDVPPVLPPGVWEEKVTLSSGKTVAVLKTHMKREGPELHRAPDGHRYLAFAYANWVFTWREKSSVVDIGFGTILNHHPEHENVGIDGEWSADVLREFGITWYRKMMARFRK